MKKLYRTFKEIGRFLISCLVVYGISYIISKIACRGFSGHPTCRPSSGKVFECATYLASISCDPSKLIFFLLAISVVILGLLAKKKKISKFWAIYFLIISVIYFFAKIVVDYALSPAV